MIQNFFKKHDVLITILIVFLTTIGSLIIFSTTYNTKIEAEGSGTISRQFAFIVIGFITYYIVSSLDLSWLKQSKVLIIIYLVTLGLLIYLKLFGNVVASTQRWIQLGFFNIQPSELAKITVIIITAFFVSISKKRLGETIVNIRSDIKDPGIIQRLNPLLTSYILSFISILPLAVLILIQPALGNTLILLMIWFLTIFFTIENQSVIVFLVLQTLLLAAALFKLFDFSSIYNSIGLGAIFFDPITAVGFIFCFVYLILKLKANIKLVGLSILAGVLIFPLAQFGWNNILQDYHRQRINTFIDGPESDQYDSGYQVIQSQIALGSGGIYGRGFLQGSQSSLRVLDFAHTDFIFAALGEQFGFIGTGFVLIVYAVLILRIFHIAATIKDDFYCLIVYGVGIMILLNVLINTGMNMGILPVTGVPLPLVSYGGSSTLVNMIGLGLVQSIVVHTKSIDISEKLLVVS